MLFRSDHIPHIHRACLPYAFACGKSGCSSLRISDHIPHIHRACLPYAFSYAQSANPFVKRSLYILHRHDLYHSWIPVFRDDVPPLPSAISPIVPSPAAFAGHELHYWTKPTTKRMMMKRTKMYCRNSSAISVFLDSESPDLHHHTG